MISFLLWLQDSDDIVTSVLDLDEDILYKKPITPDEGVPLEMKHIPGLEHIHGLEHIPGLEYIPGLEQISKGEK